MLTKILALNLLSQIRIFVSESSRRRLSLAEVQEMAEAVGQLIECVGQDAFALRLIQSIEAGLQQEICDVWPGSNATRQNVLLDTHALSGHLIWENE
ncbi:MAG: hypothetical protein JWO94_2102 [Verrucomicrobiaceae bacterium]|nr:hypothetical protein [Verrucomicrobiaceae bacterium]